MILRAKEMVMNSRPWVMLLLTTVIVSVPAERRVMADGPGSAFTEQQKLVPSDGAAGDNFGFVGVAIEGNTLVVGANLADIDGHVDQGAVYVFTRVGGIWSEEQKLIASDGAAGDSFGRYVVLSGSTLVIGAPGDDVGSNVNQGSVYVFRRLGGAWIEEQKLTSSDGAANDQFGVNIAMDAGTLVVATRFDDVGANVDQGSAYVFAKEDGAWVEQQHLIASDGAAGDFFGFSVALSGGTIVIGATMDDIGSNANQGSAYVYSRQNGVWTEHQKLTASDGEANDQFGNVTIGNSLILVGALADDVGANVNQGSTYAFARQGRDWNEVQKLTASDGAANDQFGVAHLVGSTIIVGSRFDDIGANVDQGSAHVFARGPNGWVEQQKLLARDGAAGDQFGYFVRISGKTIVLTAPGDDIDGNVNEGSVYIFGLTGD
jgi:FG-GAP repeat protein